ncbi:hypothetical protein GO986_09190 [Deinococcus sp. HMF7620]|uniref:Uncharacterized protein n=1 Tax=Deinococcus arboris TaxID=2682977 RepID=A0A7C9M8H9_9DEIO|nr:hypothetical protein [Deinococcus arboris]MVN86939.1 hypothetical protein [Deinococcus arboris]
MLPLLLRPKTDVERLFLAAAPKKIYEVLWNELTQAYPQEFRKVMENNSEKAALTLLPHARRARIETKLPALMHELGIKATVETFPDTTDTFVLVHVSDLVKLIVCYVSSKKQALRYALARELLSQEYNDPHLLLSAPTALTLSPESAFGVLAHSPHPKDVATFKKGDIIFPASNGALLGSLSLEDEMELVQLEEAQKAKEVTRTVEIKIKKGS